MIEYYKANEYIDLRDTVIPENSIWTKRELNKWFGLTDSIITKMVEKNRLQVITANPRQNYWFFGARFQGEV